MKIRIYPKRDVVLSILREKREDLQESLDGHVVPQGIEYLLKEDALLELDHQIDLVNSHAPPEVMVELEID